MEHSLTNFFDHIQQCPCPKVVFVVKDLEIKGIADLEAALKNRFPRIAVQKVVLEKSLADCLDETRQDWRYIETYSSRDRDYLDIDYTAFDLAQQWFRLDGKDMTQFEGVSYGELVQYGMIHFFSKIMKSEADVANLIKVEQPTHILCLDRPLGSVHSLEQTDQDNFHLRFLKEAADKHLVLELIHLEKKSSTLFKPVSRSQGERGSATFFQLWIRLLQRLKGKSKQNIAMVGHRKIGGKLVGLLKHSPKHTLYFLNHLDFQWVSVKSHDTKVILRHRDVVPTEAKQAHVRQFFVERLQRFHEIGDTTLHKNIAYRHVMDRIDYLFRDMFSDLYKKIYSYRRVFRNYGIKLLILGADTPVIHKTMAVAAKQSNVRTLVILHGMICHDRAPIGTFPLTSDEIVVYGPALRQKLIETGVPPGRIHITGCPRFDGYFEMLRQKPAPNPQKKVLIAAYEYNKNHNIPNSHWSLEDTLVFFGAVKTAATKFSDWTFIIKDRQSGVGFHDFLQRFFEQVPNVQITVAWNALPSLLQTSDMVVTHHSTIGLEAMIFDKPILVFSRKGLIFDLYHRQGTALEFYDAEGLCQGLRTLDRDPDVQAQLKAARAKFLKNYLFKRDGKATERVRDFALSMLKKAKDDKADRR